MYIGGGVCVPGLYFPPYFLYFTIISREEINHEQDRGIVAQLSTSNIVENNTMNSGQISVDSSCIPQLALGTPQFSIIIEFA